jgi:hypothetical protein
MLSHHALGNPLRPIHAISLSLNRIRGPPELYQNRVPRRDDALHQHHPTLQHHHPPHSSRERFPDAMHARRAESFGHIFYTGTLPTAYLPTCVLIYRLVAVPSRRLVFIA